MSMFRKLKDASIASAKAAVSGAAQGLQAAAEQIQQNMAAGVPPVDNFRRAWRQIESLLDIDFGSANEEVLARSCNSLRDSLRIVNELLREEEDANRVQRTGGDDSAPPCLEFLIKNEDHGVCGKLGRLCENYAHFPPEVTLILSEALAVMFDSVAHPMFWGAQNVQKPLCTFLQLASEQCSVANEQHISVVRLLASVCENLKSCEAELLPFYFQEGQDGSFLVFSMLLRYIDTPDNHVQISARRSLLACAQLKDSEVSSTIARSSFAAEIAVCLQKRFYAILGDLFPREGSVEDYFELLEYCNRVATMSSGEELRQAIAEALTKHLAPPLQESLVTTDGAQAIRAVQFARAMVDFIAKEEVRGREDGKADDDQLWSTHDCVQGPILSVFTSQTVRDTICEYICRQETEPTLSLEAVKLVSSLLDSRSTEIFNRLVLVSIPEAERALDELDFIAALGFPDSVDIGVSTECCEESFWTRKEFDTVSLEVAVPTENKPAPLLLALLDLLANFFNNSVEMNVVTTAALRAVLSCPHPKLECFMFSTQKSRSTLCGILSLLCTSIRDLLRTQPDMVGILRRSNDHVSSEGLESSSDIVSAVQSMLPADKAEHFAVDIVQILLLQGFVEQISGDLRAIRICEQHSS